GNVAVPVYMVPNGQPTSYSYVTWTFPSGMTCATADVPAAYTQGGMAHFWASIDGATAEEVSCLAGSVADGAVGISTPPVDPGQHTVELFGTDSNGTSLFYGIQTITTVAYTPTNEQ